jgi:hypothetical protein
MDYGEEIDIRELRSCEVTKCVQSSMGVKPGVKGQRSKGVRGRERS